VVHNYALIVKKERGSVKVAQNHSVEAAKVFDGLFSEGYPNSPHENGVKAIWEVGHFKTY
jgi:hypothetical protein